MRKIILIFCVLIMSVPVFASTISDAQSEVLYNAGSVLVMDARTGAVLYETEGYAQRYPASITKIMTALLVLENVDNLNERIVFSEYAVDLPDYAGRMGMLEGESMTALEALYGIMLPSANEVARALAEHVAGSETAFVAMMNVRAQQLGAYNTRFINPCGLPGEEQFVTAYDIALIMREAIRHPLFVEIISTPYFFLMPTEHFDETREMRNSNVLIRPGAEEFNPHVVGGKTGFTNAAQHTLVTYAANENYEVIISVLFASPRGAIFSDTTALIDYIFFGIPNIPTEEISDEIEIIIEEIEIEEEIFEEPEIPPEEFFEEPEIIPAFTYEPEEPPEEQHEKQEAGPALVASLSVGIVAFALLGVFLIRKNMHKEHLP
ncbi:MAG: D-alanyl-D-alanine carboxypeptidase [Clostridiales bacterium]|jgi:D-alanyl-D-alanine carboxypeptidase|nr:D-alanyl-D-alanine carboxypeptidase [Clostridiales bacterium]